MTLRSLSRLPAGAIRRIKRRLFAPTIHVDGGGGELLRFGSDYGGWVFEKSPDLFGSTIVSCGLGTDGSFDVEFASAFNATVIILDPTPGAILHFGQIQAKLGSAKSCDYVDGGNQPIAAYNLSELRSNSLVLESLALWTDSTTLKFFAPANQSHGSHSITNFSNRYRNDTRHIEVSSTTLGAVLEKHKLTSLPLLKLDIEGAETSVVPHMLKQGIYPRQLLIEFDEINVPSRRSKGNVESTDLALRRAGYLCRHCDGRANYLYTKDRSIGQ